MENLLFLGVPILKHFRVCIIQLADEIIIQIFADVNFIVCFLALKNLNIHPTSSYLFTEQF